MKGFLPICTLVVILAMLAVSVQPARAVNPVVSNTNDSGAGSLRQAILDAADGDMITFSLTYPAQITLTSGELVIDKSLTISGPGADQLTVSGNNASRVFNISAGVTVVIRDLAIANGHAPDGTDGADGAAGVNGTDGSQGKHGGGVYNAGSLTLLRCDLHDNRAGTGGAGGAGGSCTNPPCKAGIGGYGGYGGAGGGVYNAGTLSIEDSTLRSNSAAGGAGGAGGSCTNLFCTGGNGGNGGSGGFGGGVSNAATLSIANSTLRSNSVSGGAGGNGGAGQHAGGVGGVGGVGGDGGGVYSSRSLTVSGSTLETNSCPGGAGGGGGSPNGSSGFAGEPGSGGGIYQISSTLAVSNSTFSGNDNTYWGGGLYVGNYASVTVSNSTFAGNHARSKGGGLYLDNHASVTVSNSTCSGNSTGGAAASGGGIYNGSGSTLNLHNSLLANSTYGGDCANFGTLSANIRNLVEDGACSPALSGDPSLGTLADNGGPTQMFALNQNSKAIDAGDAATCAAADQRGAARDDLACDIGAFELKLSDSRTVQLPVSSSALTTYGPTLVGMQYTGADPGPTTVTKTGWDPQGPESIAAAWIIIPTTDTGLNLTLMLCFTEAERRDLALGELRFYRKSGSIWTQVGGAPTLSTVNGNHCATLSDIPALSPWTLATSTPTAVELRRLEARPAAGTLPALAAWTAGLLLLADGWLGRRKRH